MGSPRRDLARLRSVHQPNPKAPAMVPSDPDARTSSRRRSRSIDPSPIGSVSADRSSIDRHEPRPHPVASVGSLKATDSSYTADSSDLDQGPGRRPSCRYYASVEVDRSHRSTRDRPIRVGSMFRSTTLYLRSPPRLAMRPGRTIGNLQPRLPYSACQRRPINPHHSRSSRDVRNGALAPPSPRAFQSRS